MDNLIKFIEDNNLGKYTLDTSFKTLTTYRTGGNAKIVFYPKDIDSLIKGLEYIEKNDIKHKIFGNGSNILASDKDYDGVIIKLSSFNTLEENDNIFEVGAGYNFAKLANELSLKGYTGLEFACGIPGSVGGAVYMNAGAYLKSISDVLIDIKVLDKDMKIKTLKNEDLNYSYRNSMLIGNSYIVLSARLKLEKGDKDKIIDLINDRKKRRLASQPLEYSSAGSVFRNPEGEFAGHLIEECQLKGLNHGGAEISSKHANFIVNKDNATSSDIKYLMDLAYNEVNKKYNIKLKREQELFNWE